MSQSEQQPDLTPLRAHYLKKSLIQLQFSKELDLLASTDVPGVSNLSLLGPPFSPVPKALVSSLPPGLDLPFLKYIFRQFVLTFPFMDAAPKNFYSDKVQPFVDAMVSRNIAATSSVLDFDGSKELATRRKMIAKIERNMALFIGAATKLVEQEEVVRLTQNDLDRLERLAQKRQKRLKKNKDYFEVNIVGVRTVVDKGRVRSKAHEEFIIRTRRAGYHDTYVSRRYGDFRTLANELAKRYPEEDIKPPPAKDRSYVTAPATPQTQSFSEQLYDAATGSLGSAASYLFDDGSHPASPVTPASSHFPQSPPPNPAKLAREKNRLTLRSYLHSLMSSSAIASSPVLKSFLLSGFIELTPAELEDAKRREEADRVREDGRKRFAKEIAARVDGLREAVKSVKGDVMGKDGLTYVFGTIKVTPRIQDLPANYQAVIEWARISLASTVFHTFVASDDASATFAGLKRIHSLMPYMLLKGALKITNPIAMIRSVLDLFLAQPFGGRSLLQRMFTSSLTEEVRQLEVEIELVKEKIDDPIICEKIRMLVNAPREIQQAFKEDAVNEGMDIVVVALRSAEEPVLSRAQMHRLARAWRSYEAWRKEVRARKVREGRASSTSRGGRDDDSDDEDECPPDEDAWFIEDLRMLTGLYQKLRDKEQLIALIFEGFTAELLKDIITIFYSPLAQVYRAASIADSLSDLQNFINDLIKTVEDVEELSQTDPHQTVQAFISLIQRHEHSFYNFVHKVHSKGEGLFDNLMRWIELFLTVVREGLGQPISLEFLLPHAGAERKLILDEVDQVALYHYKLKVIYEDKLRRRFGRASGGGKAGVGDIGAQADAEDEAARALVDGVIGEISFGELVKGDAMDLAAEETDEESDSGEDSDDDESYESTSSEEGSSEYETGSEEISGTRDGKGKEKVLPPPPGQVDQSQRHRHHHHIQHPRVHHPHIHRSHHHHHQSQQIQPVQLPPPQPTRKRSMSLKQMKSMSSLLGLGKGEKEKDVPPLPPLPHSVTNQQKQHRKDGSTSDSSSIASYGTAPSTKGVSERVGGSAPVSATSSRPPSRSSTASASRVGVCGAASENAGSALHARPQVQTPNPMVGGQASPPNSIPPSPVVRSSAMPSTRPPTPSPLSATINSGTGQGPLQSQQAAPPSTDLARAGILPESKPLPPSPPPATQDQRKTPESQQTPKLRKKSKMVEPPDLKHIPQLLPVFVEMVSDT
ncbi:PX domain-containing protein [Coprinopsis cinerea okayama7|uniref:PX domain-containing protein n=1 Tax=Coprinopsis cinerea (strain Okayama-7 / 130 / ATCC MYA-4618 / FGSC 9003) TaxID=240176 RepID=D6RMW0_COPC7|nr:PX domain-containing protein [Coprinopsis cinerea okayama7\|eukprot:XP_002911201.1 PX domain-containing protein [Coprinopsis cinerea okayama7\